MSSTRDYSTLTMDDLRSTSGSDKKYRDSDRFASEPPPDNQNLLRCQLLDRYRESGVEVMNLRLSDENRQLRRCLNLLMENSELKTLNAMITLISASDEKLRKFITAKLIRSDGKYDDKRLTYTRQKKTSTSTSLDSEQDFGFPKLEPAYTQKSTSSYGKSFQSVRFSDLDKSRFRSSYFSNEKWKERTDKVQTSSPGDTSRKSSYSDISPPFVNPPMKFGFGRSPYEKSSNLYRSSVSSRQSDFPKNQSSDVVQKTSSEGKQTSELISRDGKISNGNTLSSEKPVASVYLPGRHELSFSPTSQRSPAFWKTRVSSHATTPRDPSTRFCSHCGVTLLKECGCHPARSSITPYYTPAVPSGKGSETPASFYQSANYGIASMIPASLQRAVLPTVRPGDQEPYRQSLPQEQIPASSTMEEFRHQSMLERAQEERTTQTEQADKKLITGLGYMASTTYENVAYGFPRRPNDRNFIESYPQVSGSTDSHQTQTDEYRAPDSTEGQQVRETLDGHKGPGSTDRNKVVSRTDGHQDTGTTDGNRDPVTTESNQVSGSTEDYSIKGLAQRLADVQKQQLNERQAKTLSPASTGDIVPLATSTPVRSNDPTPKIFNQELVDAKYTKERFRKSSGRPRQDDEVTTYEERMAQSLVSNGVDVDTIPYERSLGASFPPVSHPTRDKHLDSCIDKTRQPKRKIAQSAALSPPADESGGSDSVFRSSSPRRRPVSAPATEGYHDSYSLAEVMGFTGSRSGVHAAFVIHRPVDILTNYTAHLTPEIITTLATCKPNRRIVGEIAFQLDRRILEYVFAPDKSSRRRSRYYGYSVSSIMMLIDKEVKETPKKDLDRILRLRLELVLHKLARFGYSLSKHADFTQNMVNRHGLLHNPPAPESLEEVGLTEPAVFRVILGQVLREQEDLDNMLIVLDCLQYMSYLDGRPLFIY